MAELTPRLTFVSSPKQPVVVFHTSSRAKFAQALTMFDIAGLRLSFRAHDALPYEEKYEGSKEQLLTEAVQEIRNRGGANSYFFVEDTSIRIDALSTPETDYPGLMAKEWFAEANFDELLEAVRAKGDRACTVKSGIALSIPGLHMPVFFFGETHGRIVEELSERRESNVFHPWLSADTFNSWFIPDGASKPLSEMSFEESIRHDFRAVALTGLLDRLEEYSLALNLPPGGYSRKIPSRQSQATLFSIAEPILLIVGPTCAGKTTFGIHVQQTQGWRFIDASSIVKIMRQERSSEERIGEFAAKLLSMEGADVVARYIATNMVRSATDPAIITGFRTIEEVEFFRDHYDHVKVVSLSAPQRLRYERYINRNTRDVRTLTEFEAIDEEQHRLGLLRVADHLADVKVENIYSEVEYSTQIAAVLGASSTSVRGVSQVERRLEPEVSQLYRCLTVLRNIGRPLTTQEISEHLSDRTIRYNNANKILKRYPELAHRQESPGANVRYNVTPAGLAFLSAIDRLNS